MDLRLETTISQALSRRRRLLEDTRRAHTREPRELPTAMADSIEARGVAPTRPALTMRSTLALSAARRATASAPPSRPTRPPRDLARLA
jgi:hypothetical protein